MPAVISRKAKQMFYFRKDEFLGEILGHSNFDGYPFTLEDQVVFENGTTARIIRESGQQFHVWSECTCTTVRGILDACHKLEVDIPEGASETWSFEQLFEALAHLPEPRWRLFRTRWTR